MKKLNINNVCNEGLKNTFSNNLNEIMKERGYSGCELARLLDLNNAQVYKYIRKECLPSSYILMKISNILNISIDCLMGNLSNDYIADMSSLKSLSIKNQKLIIKLKKGKSNE